MPTSQTACDYGTYTSIHNHGYHGRSTTEEAELCKTKECFVGSAWPGHCGWSTGTILSPQPFSQFSRFSPDI